MKITKYIIGALLLPVTLVSCDGLFRDAPNDKLSEEVIWENERLLDEYVLPWYRNMDNGFRTYVTTLMKGLGYEYEPWYGEAYSRTP